MSKFVPSTQQAQALEWVPTGTGSAVVLAVAGAGKTTTLVEMVRLMRGSVFLGAYNKKMAEELKSRITDLPNVRAGTFHSAGFSTLRRALGNIRVDDKKVRNLATEYVRRTNLAECVPAICTLVSLAKQAGYGIDGIPVNLHELADHHDVWDRVPESIQPFEMIRAVQDIIYQSVAQTDVVDFDDMVYLPLLLNLRFWKNDWVLIDEAQDTNATRREMAARMLAPGGRLVAVGDPHQAIFGFTGADSDSLALIQKKFNAQTLTLSVSFRCPQVVVKAAQEYVHHIEAAPSAPLGEHLSMSLPDMLKLTRPGDAILCRFNKYLVSTAFKLIRQGVACKIEGRAIGEGLAALVGRWKVRDLDKLEERLATWQDRELAKAREKEDEAKEERIVDQYETLKVLIERGREQGIETVDGLRTMIKDMFDDVGAAKNLVVLSSVHRSKGLEWNRVFLLGRGTLMPSPRARKDWQKEQEINLVYVAVTRAKETLVDVECGAEA